jgi:phosphohistidine phosphatase
MKQPEKSETKRLRLIFIRHARAEEQTPEISDYERSLTTRGKLHSRLMAQILKSKGENPGKVISSPAFRALETALIFCREFAIAPGSVEICPELYTGLDPDEYVPFIRRQSDEAGTITIVGHNPLITDMAVFFAADEPTDLPKTGIFCVSFSAGKWSEVEPDSGTTEYFLTPKTHL